MIPTYVFGWPTGEELGDFLALDLGAYILQFQNKEAIAYDLSNLQVAQTSASASSA